MSTDPFPVTSRYYGAETAELKTAGGKTVVYLRRRFVPPPENFELLLEHTVADGERLDNIATRYFGDPELFWRICDANGAMEPAELTARPGRRLRITPPEGIPGLRNA